MAKKNRGARAGQTPGQTMKAGGAERISAPITRPGWSLIGGGAACVVLGFLALTRVDPMARNAFSVVSPALILSGYGLVALGLAWPPREEGGENLPPSPPAAR